LSHFLGDGPTLRRPRKSLARSIDYQEKLTTKVFELEYSKALGKHLLEFCTFLSDAASESTEPPLCPATPREVS